MEFIREAGHVGTSYDSHASTLEPASWAMILAFIFIFVVVFNSPSRHKARFGQ